jgi:hypothetical protein
MPNHAEEKRIEENREEEKRKEEKREEDKWFNVFWDSFGKKQDLQKCQAKWSKLTEKEKNAALDKVAGYVHSTPDVQFRKNPLTWLNGKCWEDEIIIPTLNTKISNFEKAVKADLHSMIIYDNDNE